MHVLYTIGQGEGGLPHYTAELANAVADHHDVTVLKPSTTTADDLFDDAVTVREPFRSINISMSKLYTGDLRPSRVLRGLASYRHLDLIEDLDPDVVHETTGLFPHTKFFAWYHGISQDRPFVVTRHEVPHERFSLSRPPVFVEELCLSLVPDPDVDRYIVHTEQQRDALARQKGPDAAVDVIPHGSYSIFGDHTDLDADPEPNTVLFFGNLVPPKGIDTFVDAMARVADSLDDVTAIIAGDGSIPARSRRVIDAHPDAFEVHNYFVPNEDVKTFFGRAQVVAAPYREQGGTKGHSGVLSTAFSFGTPVVASTAGVFPEYVGESGAGRVVPPEDPDALADALVDVLGDDDRRETMARRSLDMADRLSWDRIGATHADLYESLVATETDRSTTTEYPRISPE